jgi:tRNA-splicing ligase RtcB (3'-phosphate/5'-hydroxy nucleic acid ligase)
MEGRCFLPENCNASGAQKTKPESRHDDKDSLKPFQILQSCPVTSNMTKFTRADFLSSGIHSEEWMQHFGRVCKRLMRSGTFSKPELLDIFPALLDAPERFTNDPSELSELAVFVIEQRCKPDFVKQKPSEPVLKARPLPFAIYGMEGIAKDALEQMETAMRLPVSCAGALMADAHTGYGLPIGGVLATEGDVVIPYAVGVDIACRMCMSVYNIPGSRIDTDKEPLISVLLAHTYFGLGVTCKDHLDTAVFDNKAWGSSPVIRSLKDKAWSQLGTSGEGNHFAEWGILEVQRADALNGIPPGNYLALLSHSGSRGFGNEIASYFSKVAMQKTKLPSEARHLAWLNTGSEEGQEYWTAMTLAGEYASANHHEIHNKISAALGLKPLLRIENHHNFAWKEKLSNGKEVTVHRKGATPAGKNNTGIIPGSMTHPGFVVRGTGRPESLNSASHGAGRVMSRNAAFQKITFEDMQHCLSRHGVTLIGGDMDEAPMAYKDIETVMQAQHELVEVLARFVPKIVRMADGGRKRRRGRGA